MTVEGKKTVSKSVTTRKRQTSVSAARLGPSLRSLEYSPHVNPLMEGQSVEVKRRFVSGGLKRDLVDPLTGEISGASVIREVVEKDDAEFVKVFAGGISAAFGLSRTAARVFQLVLEMYQAEPMVGGYADSVYLAWFDDGLCGRDVGMTDRTFHAGLRELLAKGFLAGKAPNVYWVNAGLFFKGDRVLFIKEYRRKRATHQDELERRGQQRLSIEEEDEQP